MEEAVRWYFSLPLSSLLLTPHTPPLFSLLLTPHTPFLSSLLLTPHTPSLPSLLLSPHTPPLASSLTPHSAPRLRYSKAAELGNPEAQFSLGACFQEGEFGSRNKTSLFVFRAHEPTQNKHKNPDRNKKEKSMTGIEPWSI
jgi:hypothetical protein